MEQRNKNIIIGGLLAVLVVMAVGYAAFATQLNINGIANIESRWDVHIQSIDEGSPSGTAANVKTDVEQDRLKAMFECTFKSPGDSITYTVEVKNEGNLNAVLDNIVFSEEENPAITYSYDGINISDELPATESRQFTVTVTYNPAVTSQPAVITEALTMTLSYSQKEA